MNKTLKVIIVFFAFLLVFSLIAEITLRSIGYYYCPLRIKILEKKLKGLGKTDYRPFHILEDKFAVYDSNLIWRPKKNYKIFNTQGFRGPTVDIIKKMNEFRIFTIGDSNTLGLAYDFGWPEYLGQLIKKRYPDAIVINAGVWGYSSWQGLKRFEEVLKYKPDIVLISFGANDAHRVIVSDKEYIASKRFFRSKIADFKVCQLFIALSDILLIKNREIENSLVPRVNLKEYNDNLNRIITLANKNHVKIILLTRPFIGESHHKLWWKNFAPQYNKLTMKIAKDNSVLAIDIYSHFKNKKEYFADESHFNSNGNKVAAELIYDYIKI